MQCKVWYCRVVGGVVLHEPVASKPMLAFMEPLFVFRRNEKTLGYLRRRGEGTFWWNLPRSTCSNEEG